MHLEVKQEKGILLVKPLEKSIEAANCKDFKSKIIELLDEGDKNLILNLSEVEFMDSTGLGSMISILKVLANAEGQLLICEARAPVARVFDLTRLNKVFQLFPNEKEALNSLNHGIL